MSNPQQPELARSRKTPAQDQDAVSTVIEGQRQPGAEGPTGPVPAGNQPGHHPPKEQDKPDLDAFAEKLGAVEPSEGADADGPGERLVTAAREAGGRRGVVIGVAGALGTFLAVVLAVLAGRRRRSRRSRR